MFRKTLIRVESALSALMETIFPSAGETATSPAGTSRSGSRKK
jgi:hypothetical protein